MKNILLIIFYFLCYNKISAQTFQHVYGNNRNERCQSIWPTQDGGFLLNGATTSFGNGDVDALIIKTDAQGNVLWSNLCGTSANEIPTIVSETFDNKFIFIGSSDTSLPGTLTDALLFKTDSLGNFMWAKSFGGTNNESANRIIELSSHDYVFTGSTESYGAGSSDIYFIKTDVNGDTIFTRIYGSTDTEASKSIAQTSDGGFILCGKSSAMISGQLVIKAILMRIDQNGNLLWSKLYGDTLFQEAQSVAETSDGGFIVCGSRDYTSSGNYDILLFKTDSLGDIQWSKTYGGNKGEGSYTVNLNEDGTYVLSGYTNSMGFGHRGNDSTNVFLMKTDAFGDTIWTRTYGDSLQEEAFLSARVSDGGYILSGFNDYHNADSSQMLVIKTDSLGFSGCYGFTSHPVIVTNLLTMSSPTYTQSSGMAMNTLALISNPVIISDSTICLTLDIPDASVSENIYLFPNPTTDKLFLFGSVEKLNVGPDNLNIDIYNVLGEKMHEFQISNVQNNFIELDVSRLNPGMYIVNVFTKTLKLSYKFVRN